MDKKTVLLIVTLISAFILYTFIFTHYVQAEENIPIPYTDIYMGSNDFKSYMSYKAITKSDSPQYMLQELCSTDMDGFRKCADRYVIAVGHGVGGQVGDCVDLILANGEVIYCVIGDYKQNKHTDKANLTGKNGCCSEFIVDVNRLREDIKKGGNIECGYAGWDSPVLYIRRYNINYLGGIVA